MNDEMIFSDELVVWRGSGGDVDVVEEVVMNVMVVVVSK